MLDFILGFFILLIALFGLSKLAGRFEFSTTSKRLLALGLSIPIAVGFIVGIGYGIATFTGNPRWTNPLLWEEMHSKYHLDQSFDSDSGSWAMSNGWNYYEAGQYIRCGLEIPAGFRYTGIDLTEISLENQTVFAGKDYLWARMRYYGYDNYIGGTKDYEITMKMIATETIQLNETVSQEVNHTVVEMYYQTATGTFKVWYYDLDDLVHEVSTATTTRIGINGWAYFILEFDWVQATLGMYGRLLDPAGTPIATLTTEMPPNAMKIRYWEFGAVKIGGGNVHEIRLDEIILWEATQNDLAWGWLDGLVMVFAPLMGILFFLLGGIVAILVAGFTLLVNALIMILNAIGSLFGIAGLGTSIVGIGSAIFNFLGFVVTNIGAIFGWVVDLIGFGLSIISGFIGWLVIIPVLISIDFIFIALRMAKQMSVDPLKEGVEKYMNFGRMIFSVFRGIASVVLKFLSFIAGLVPFT